MTDLISAHYDIETTGLLDPDHRIIEIYIGLYKGRSLVWELNQRIDPQRSIGIEAQRVHGITASDLFGKPIFATVAPDILKAFSKASYSVAHNGNEFDWKFLQQEMKRVGLRLPDMPMVDTMLEGIWATADGKKPRLEELCYACGVPYDKTLAHAAEYDVNVMAQCFFRGVDWEFYTLPEGLGIAKAA